MSVATYDASYSILFRFHGSVVPHVTPAVLFFAAWSAAVVAVDRFTVLSLGITNIVVTILSFVISLLLVFRTNTAYDRYWEGRKVWSNMVLAIRNVSRLLWILIPDEKSREKDLAVHLLHAFALSVKCYLHGTDPFVDMEQQIEAIRPVIPTLKEYFLAIQSENYSPDGWSRDLSFLERPNEPANHGDTTQANTPCNDDTLRGPQYSDDSRRTYNADATASPLHHGGKRHKHHDLGSAVHRTLRRDKATAEDLQMEHATVPYVVSIFLQNYVIHERDAGNVDSVHLSAILAAINVLTECLTGFERIQRTPIPIAYAIHLHQTVLLYILVLPFQLLTNLGWATVPIVALSAFTMLGVLHIAKEIENPFGFDYNDLPLDDFCKVIGQELNDMTAYNPPKVEDWLPYIQHYKHQEEVEKEKERGTAVAATSASASSSSLNEKVSLRDEKRNNDDG